MIIDRPWSLSYSLWGRHIRPRKPPMTIALILALSHAAAAIGGAFVKVLTPIAKSAAIAFAKMILVALGG